MRKTHVVFVALLIGTMPILAEAQTIAPRFFAGAGIGFGIDDAVERFTSLYPGVSDTFVRAWLADGGGWVTPRVAIGAELFRPPEITARVSRSVQVLDETERETALLATLRIRPFGGRIVAVDALGGGGLLITSRQRSGRLFLPWQNESFSSSESATTSTFVGGVDLTLHAARHWDIAPLVRLYRFNRDVTGSMIDHSSNHFIFGFITRATW